MRVRGGITDKEEKPIDQKNVVSSAVASSDLVLLSFVFWHAYFIPSVARCDCSGSLSERAARLFSVKGKERKDYPMKVRGKGFVV